MNISLRRIEDKSGYCFAFSLCDGKGPEGVRSLYNMIPKEELGYEILTELVMVLKWKLFEYDNKKWDVCYLDAGAFYMCKKLTSVVLPDGIEEIAL